jgi:hypothetical protein
MDQNKFHFVNSSILPPDRKLHDIAKALAKSHAAKVSYARSQTQRRQLSKFILSPESTAPTQTSENLPKCQYVVKLEPSLDSTRAFHVLAI